MQCECLKNLAQTTNLYTPHRQRSVDVDVQRTFCRAGNGSVGQRVDGSRVNGSMRHESMGQIGHWSMDQMGHGSMCRGSVGNGCNGSNESLVKWVMGQWDDGSNGSNESRVNGSNGSRVNGSTGQMGHFLDG